MALYHGYYSGVPTRTTKKDPKKSSTRPSASPSQPALSADSSMEQLSSASIENFLGPAVDNPPSPGKLRQLTKQMKRASHLQRQNGHRTASSESSSISSMNNGDRLPWELALDNLSLVRRSSNRSNDSSTPSRDRPESVHKFGKNVFHRRGKSKRESSAHSSGASSIYSGEAPTESVSSAGLKDGIIPSLFSKRKPSRDEAIQKRPAISGPFNFQHVTHTQRDHSSHSNNVPPVRRLEATATEATRDVRTMMNTHDATQNSLRFTTPAESMGDMQDDYLPGITRPTLVPRHTAPASGPRRLLKHIRSQEQLRTNQPQPPPRPPRSPLQATSSPPLPQLPPQLPPPRVSSRQSIHHDMADAFTLPALGRSQMNSESHQSYLLSPPSSPDYPANDPNYGQFLSSELDQSLPDEKRFSRVMLGARDSTWPLTITNTMSYETPLADVPEEEENHGVSRKSRLSLASNNSSLRGSQSVPMLRSFADSQRPTSGASETLGGLGIMGMNRLINSEPQSPGFMPGSPFRENWEDDIDYCYEHEAEATCDYQWERPSLDTMRDSITPPARVPFADDELAEASQASLAGLGKDRAANPIAHTAAEMRRENTIVESSFTNNFSLPRGDRRSIRPAVLKEKKGISGLSSFRESEAFTLSPSLLIPGDYQQQMFLAESERHGYTEYDEFAGQYNQHAFHGDATLAMSSCKSSPSTYQRSSTSTTETNSTSRSNSTGKQHRSTNSSWTTLARRTASSTSLKQMASALADEQEPLPTPHIAEVSREDPDVHQPLVPTDSQDSVPEMIPFPSSTGLKRYHHKSHASESVVREGTPPLGSPESNKPRRARARTTSLSTQSPPPVGQYALFPRPQVKANGDHI